MVTSPIYKEITAQDLTTLGARMRMDYQGTRLTGNNSLNPVMTHYVKPNYPQGEKIDYNKWFIPLTAFASVTLVFLALGSRAWPFGAVHNFPKLEIFFQWITHQ